VTGAPPPLSLFTGEERRLIRRLRTPAAVQAFLNALPYNTEPPPDPATLRSFRGVVGRHTAHCLEAAISAAVILEQHGYPPRVMSLESIDELDHVIFVYQQAGRWGSVARSRDPGLHGRKPVFRSLRHLALTYFEPFIDATGCLKAYGAVDLRVLGSYDWRLAPGNVWKVERLLFEIPHRPIASSPARVKRLRRRYFDFKQTHPDRKPIDYYDQRTWTAIPGDFRR
jgi:hypothetical protein